MKKEGFLFGYLCLTEERFNGQKIRTNSVRRLLEDYLGYTLSFYDTLRFRKNPLSLIPALFQIRKYDKIFVILAHNGVKILLPLIIIFASFFNKKVYYVAIGGWLPQVMSKNKYLKSFLKRIEIIFLQSDIMRSKILEDVQPAKVELLPNFKFHSFSRDFKAKEDTALKVVYISRVGRQKGLDTIEYLAHEIKKNQLSIFIDLYGPIAPEDENYLKEILLVGENVKYKGIAKGEEVFSTLEQYDVMIFPTHHMTEGFPGVILDAFISGLPVIASNWDYSSEFIKPEFGFVFQHDKPAEALKQLIFVMDNPDILYKMQQNSYINRSKYSVEAIAASLASRGL